MKCGYLINIMQGGKQKWVPCGQCMPCRINKKRMVTGRIVLEAQYQELPSTFLTLTYDEKHLPDRGSLEPRDLAEFTNRFRARRAIAALGNPRWFAVAEYGTESWRPHYHLSLFGVPPEYEQEMNQAWGLGHIKAGDITVQSASYIAGYTTKKMTSARDCRLIDTGLHPEFTRMSRYPPLGAAGYHKAVLPALMTRQGAIAIAEHGDVPTSFSTQGRTWPMGQYWRNWLRRELGITKPPEYEPWVLDPESFRAERESAEKKAVKARQNAIRKASSTRTL